MAVQIAALAFVIRQPMARIEFETAGDGDGVGFCRGHVL
jgi:hypothetical protein